jgi:DNA replication and repair protein RecF
MSITRLEIHNLRNLIKIASDINSRFNLIYGQNGSGKTSLLEAIHYLGLGRSFRTHLNSRAINNESDSMAIFGQIANSENIIPIGIERTRNGEGRIRIHGENVNSTAELAKLLPIQFINAEAHRSLLTSPKHRREFLDWGVFHVEHSFFPVWLRSHRALKQRNAALRNKAPLPQIQLWDRELAVTATELNQLRENYINQFTPTFLDILRFLLPEHITNLNYQQGWPRGADLEQVLRDSVERDLQLGYSQFGPQRADLLLTVSKTPVQDILSQGQQKLLAYALRLSQGVLLQKQVNKKCVYLIDDLPAELDQTKQSLVAKILIELNTQVFVTGIERAQLMKLFPAGNSKMFHVEHGTIVEEEAEIVSAV